MISALQNSHRYSHIPFCLITDWNVSPNGRSSGFLVFSINKNNFILPQYIDWLNSYLYRNLFPDISIYQYRRPKFSLGSSVTDATFPVCDTIYTYVAHPHYSSPWKRTQKGDMSWPKGAAYIMHLHRMTCEAKGSHAYFTSWYSLPQFQHSFYVEKCGSLYSVRSPHTITRR